MLHVYLKHVSWNQSIISPHQIVSFVLFKYYYYLPFKAINLCNSIEHHSFPLFLYIKITNSVYHTPDAVLELGDTSVKRN